MHRCASNFCQDLGESSELTTHTQRVARALGICSAHTESTCYLTNQTNAQRVAGVRNEWPKHAALHGHALEARWVCAQCALGDRKTSADEHACIPSVCSACVWCWSSALCACLASFWRGHVMSRDEENILRKALIIEEIRSMMQ